MATQQHDEKTADVVKPAHNRNSSQSPEMALIDDLTEYFSEYAKQRPGMIAAWSFGLGFVIGWKLKPW